MYRKLARPFFVTGLFVLSCNLFAQSPGGIAHHSVWFNGNFFPDSGRLSSLNFNPATTLDAGPSLLKPAHKIGDLRRATIFTVYQKPASNQDTSVWQLTGSFGAVALSTRQVSGDSGKLNLIYQNSKLEASDFKKPIATLSTYIRRISKKPEPDNDAATTAAVQFGNALQSSGKSSGLVAEFIVYETILKPKDIARIETYLALKYGITLQANYVNSLGSTLWDRKAEAQFSNNIAGIGRDDQSSLYQKQSTSGSAGEQLVIGAGTLAPSNQKNSASLHNHDYLIWGDNANAFLLDETPKPTQQNVLLAAKKWVMKRIGTTANAISTSVQIDTKTLLPPFYPKQNFCLAIDRSGLGDFAESRCSFLLPDSISADGIASFSNIVWDTDGSGNDVFTFGVKPGLSTAVTATNETAGKLLSFHIFPNPLTNGRYTIAATLDKPAALIVQVFDLRSHLIDTRKVAGQADYRLSGIINGTAGAYIIKLSTPANAFSQIVIKQ